MSEPTTSTAAGSATLRHTAANGVTAANDGWNVGNGNAMDIKTLASSTSSAATECRQNCRRFCVKVQIEPVPQKLPVGLNGNLNVPDGDTNDDRPESESRASPVPNGQHISRSLQDQNIDVGRPRPRLSPIRTSAPLPPVTTTTSGSGPVSAVPRLPMILSVDGISDKLDQVEKTSTTKLSKRLDRVSHRHEFRDQIFIIDGE